MEPESTLVYHSAPIHLMPNEKVTKNEEEKLFLILQDMISYIEKKYAIVFPQMPANISIKTCISNISPFFIAAAIDVNNRVLNYLLRLGSNINYTDENKNNALFHACKALEQNPKKFKSVQRFVNKLLENNCNPFQKNVSGICPLELLEKNKLLNSNTSIDLIGKIPDNEISKASNLLHQTSDKRIIDLLINRDGCCIETRDFCKRTPLYNALARGELLVVEHLLSLGANFKISLPHVQMAQYRDIRLFQVLIKYGWNINQQDVDRNIPLILISKCSYSLDSSIHNTLFILDLIKLGASLTQQNHAGECALEFLIASEGFFDSQIKAFLEYISESFLNLTARTRSLTLLNYFYPDSEDNKDLDPHGNNLLMASCNYIIVQKLPEIELKFIQSKESRKNKYQARQFIEELVHRGFDLFQENHLGKNGIRLIFESGIYDNLPLPAFLLNLDKDKLHEIEDCIHTSTTYRELAFFIDKGVSIDLFDSNGLTLLQKEVLEIYNKMVLSETAIATITELINLGADPWLETRHTANPKTSYAIINEYYELKHKKEILEKAPQKTLQETYRKALLVREIFHGSRKAWRNRQAIVTQPITWNSESLAPKKLKEQTVT